MREIGSRSIALFLDIIHHHSTNNEHFRPIKSGGGGGGGGYILVGVFMFHIIYSIYVYR